MFICWSARERESTSYCRHVRTRTGDTVRKHGNYNLYFCNNIERAQFMGLARMVRLLLHVIYYTGPHNTPSACRFARNDRNYNDVQHDIFRLVVRSNFSQLPEARRFFASSTFSFGVICPLHILRVH